ncbi:hypothetical protein H2200_007862 [Cladophialophora chaetospira]|uniref:Uncharacterized protein n=1 Tax=Cladophialophora chaetospira TaxID=386627 RepID=A0AA39CH00_9EURO|nr:hypothetical protein H2200_007862 [Cladophialophora chaetospira]
MEIYGMLGEKLGTIGKSTQDDKQQEVESLPQWKKDFLQKPSISVRNGIAWGYDPPYEDTDTLVLTSTQSGFVDIRFPRKRELGKPIASDPSFWAFCGTSTTTFLQGDGIDMPYSSHCVWKHEIDSKGPGIDDEGDMFLLANGDCMEVGMMQNTQTGKVQMYKEYWTSPGDSGKIHLVPCVVAKTTESPNDHEAQESSLQNGSGGVIIRIGNFCQGIMRQQAASHEGRPMVADAVLVERWTRGLVSADGNPNTTTAGEQTSTATSLGWVQDWRSNTPSDTNISMPCAWVFDDSRQIGDKVEVKGTTWTIVEALLEMDQGV